MKKFLFTCLILFGFLISIDKVNAQTSKIQIPGVDCGNSEAEEASKRVCCKKNISIPDPGSAIVALKGIPGIGSTIYDYYTSLLQLQKSTNIVACPIGYPSTSDQNDSNCVCLKQSQITPSPIENIQNMCRNYINNTGENKLCLECADKNGYWSSLGCVYGNPSIFISEIVLRLGISFSGMIALICIIYSAVQIQTSGGNPEKIKKAQQLLTSCISGLILIIFSIFILRLIGVNILKIPGFG